MIHQQVKVTQGGQAVVACDNVTSRTRKAKRPHGYEATGEATMAAFAKSWRRE
jgi:hypothetical protein